MFCSTPVKPMKMDPIEILKKNVGDTLTFLHQERNDFLPDDDIIIPSRKDDHVSNVIDLDYISTKSPKKNENENLTDLRSEVEYQISEVIKQAEDTVNDLKLNLEEKSDSLLDDNKNTTEDTLDNLESLKEDSISNAQEKSEEAFKFLENEASSPLPVNKTIPEELTFIQKEIDSIRSEIESVNSSPTSASNEYIEVKNNEQSLDSNVLSDRNHESPTENDLLSRIPISTKDGKIKTIKKHSKDPLKEFVKLSQDFNWDDEGKHIVQSTTVTDPIVKTTINRISAIDGEILRVMDEIPEQILEKIEASPKSKIPILKTETIVVSPIHFEETKIAETITSPISVISTKSSTLDSDSEDDSHRSPPIKGIIRRGVGSSSGSDVALHEEGAELSEDESGMRFIKLFFSFVPTRAF